MFVLPLNVLGVRRNMGHFCQHCSFIFLIDVRGTTAPSRLQTPVWLPWDAALSAPWPTRPSYLYGRPSPGVFPPTIYSRVTWAPFSSSWTSTHPRSRAWLWPDAKVTKIENYFQSLFFFFNDDDNNNNNSNNKNNKMHYSIKLIIWIGKDN